MPPGFQSMFAGMFGEKGKGKGKGKSPMGPDFADDDDEDTDSDRPKGAGGSPGGEKKEVDNSRLYDLLQVDKEASSAEIKKAYHRAAMKHHPDKGGDPETFKDIQKAFEVLSDPEKRQRYDRLGDDGLKESASGGPPDLFEHLFGGGGGGRRGAGQRQRTKDKMRPMWVTLEQLYGGVTRPLPIVRKVVEDADAAEACGDCGGKGFVVQIIQMGPMVQQMRQPCPSCGGRGSSASMKAQREVLDVFVEKGSPDGHKIVVHGKADEAPGCDPGDVVVVVRQQDHPKFMRKGSDLYLQREVSLVDALTGFRIEVQHLDGRMMVVKSKPGEVLQPQHSGLALKGVAGGGMPIHQDPFQYGNLFLMLCIRYPTTVDPVIATELRRLLGAEPVDAENGFGSGTDDQAAVDVETVEAEDIDPLESAKQSKKPSGGEAYDEDADGPGMQRMECKQQ